MPVEVGEKATLKDSDWPGGIVTGGEIPVTLKGLPVRLTDWIVHE